MQSRLLTVDQLTVRRGGRTVIEKVSLNLNPGSKIAIRGRNGSGKTTLIRAILGLLPSSEGIIKLEGFTVGSREWKGQRNRAGWVPQDGVLHRFPISGEEVVATGLVGRRLDRNVTQERIAKAMEETECAHLAKRCFHRLSGGERKRLLIARGLAQGASVLLLDEPTSGLDIESRSRLEDLLDALASEGRGIIAVTHEPDVFQSESWDMKILEDGRLC